MANLKKVFQFLPECIINYRCKILVFVCYALTECKETTITGLTQALGKILGRQTGLLLANHGRCVSRVIHRCASVGKMVHLLCWPPNYSTQILNLSVNSAVNPALSLTDRFGAENVRTDTLSVIGREP